MPHLPSRRAVLGVLPVVAAGVAVRSTGDAAAAAGVVDDGRLTAIAECADGWLARRTGTGVPVTSASTVLPDRPWPREWTGPVSGRCRWDGVPDEVRARARVRGFATTDSRYPAGERAIDPDGRFAFADFPRGAKSLEVVDPVTGDVLAEWAPATGLVRSYDVPADDPRSGRCWTYDQALAVLAALAAGDDARAAEHARGLLRLQVGGTQDGAFVVNAAVLDPEGADREHRTGSSAVATYALLTWARRLPAGGQRGEALAAAARGCRWLLAQQLRRGPRAGLVTGGRGEWRAGGLVPDVRVTWAATEHALDCWQAWSLAARVLPEPADRRAVRGARDRLEQATMRRLWLPGPGRFRRGDGPDGPDDADPLDAASWGTVFLAGAGRPRSAARTLAHTRRFASEGDGVRGHRPYRPQPAFPDPPELVWVEGSCGVALAEAAVGRPDRACGTLLALAPLQQPDGAFPYATAADPMTGMDRAASVAATAWWRLAAAYGGPLGSIWDPAGRSDTPFPDTDFRPRNRP